MTKEFVPYKQALALKELGFDEPCYDAYTLTGGGESTVPPEKYNHRQDAVAAPLYQQAFRFFREKYNLRGFIGFRPNVKKFDYHVYDMSLSGEEYAKQRTMAEYNKDPLVGTYEEAELECLKKLIQIVNEKSV